MLAEPAGGSLTSGRRQNHVGVLGRSGDLGDPSTVALKGPSHCHLLGHFLPSSVVPLTRMDSDFTEVRKT